MKPESVEAYSQLLTNYREELEKRRQRSQEILQEEQSGGARRLVEDLQGSDVHIRMCLHPERVAQQIVAINKFLSGCPEADSVQAGAEVKIAFSDETDPATYIIPSPQLTEEVRTLNGTLKPVFPLIPEMPPFLNPCLPLSDALAGKKAGDIFTYQIGRQTFRGIIQTVS